MKRIDIVYGGELYSVGGREFEDVRQEVLDGMLSAPQWLRVNDGEGMRREAFLLLTPGVPIALVPVPGEASSEPDPTSIEEIHRRRMRLDGGRGGPPDDPWPLEL